MSHNEYVTTADQIQTGDLIIGRNGGVFYIAEVSSLTPTEVKFTNETGHAMFMHVKAPVEYAF